MIFGQRCGHGPLCENLTPLSRSLRGQHERRVATVDWVGTHRRARTRGGHHQQGANGTSSPQRGEAPATATHVTTRSHTAVSEGGCLNSVKTGSDSSIAGLHTISRSFSGERPGDGNSSGPVASERPYLTRATCHSAPII